jgi:hypothetical protein
VTPALFIPYFLWKRAWKTVAACLVGLGLFFVIIPGAVLGAAHNQQLLHSWTKQMILPYMIEGQVTTEHNNQSLPGLLYRLGTHSPSFLDEQDQPVEYHNLLDLDPQVTRLIVKLCSLAFLAVMCWSCRTPTQPREQWRLAAEYSVIVLGMLLFSERTWKHHCVTMLLPFALLCYYLAAFKPGAGWRGYLIGSMAAATVLMASTSTSLWDLFGNRLGAKMAQVYGGYVWAELVLLAAVLALLVKHRGDGGQIERAESEW